MRTIMVTGQGVATAVPDRAVLRLAAVHRGDSMAEAVAGVESVREALVAAAGDMVVSSVDLNVWPAHDPEGRQTGFEARHAFTVTGAGLKAAADLLGRLVDDTANRLQLESVSMSVSDPRAAYADALARAQHLASLAGVALGEVQAVTEGVGPGAPVAQEAVFAAKTDVTLQPGQATLGVALSVTWNVA
jgi:uncharacterized protein YggE